MELILKTAAAALAASAIGVLIKKSNPELSLLLGISLTVLILSAAMSFIGSLKELAASVGRLLKGNEFFIAPVLKCLAVALITKMSSELCRDSSQAAAASALEFAGSVCAMSISMPLILSVLKMIGGFL